jgi:hypothetical protein
MKCCKKELPEPDIIDGTAYFVCPECGGVREVENYRTYTTEERIEVFEKEYGVKLPNDYVKYTNCDESWVVKLTPPDTGSTKPYFGEGFYSIGDFSGVDPDKYLSIFDSAYLSDTWDLPEKLVLIDGDGHDWIALDYRDSDTTPKVIVIESEGGESVVVANSFEEFVSMLLPYESVYDPDGNIIYNG